MRESKAKVVGEQEDYIGGKVGALRFLESDFLSFFRNNFRGVRVFRISESRVCAILYREERV